MVMQGGVGFTGVVGRAFVLEGLGQPTWVAPARIYIKKRGGTCTFHPFFSLLDAVYACCGPLGWITVAAAAAPPASACLAPGC